MPATPVLEVDRTTTTTTSLVTDDLGELADGAVRFRVDRFAVTANTVTYAQFGDMLGYWDFFPSADPASGRVPAMGWADVVASAHPEVAVGGRYYGWFPMAGAVDVVVSPTSSGLRDDGAHRSAHAPVYRSYVETTKDPLYPRVDDAALRGDLEDRHALLRGLFLTGFLVDVFLAAHDYYGADAVVVLSASSKTGIAVAHQAAARGLGAVIGVTSAANRAFVESLGTYTDVVTYDEVGAIAVRDAVAVDMAGDGSALAALHERFGDRLGYSMTVGRTHNDAPPAAVSAGPAPEMFFAPMALEAIGPDAAGDDLDVRSAAALAAFIDDSIRWLHPERARGPEACEITWARVHAGAVPPDVGCIASLHGDTLDETERA